MMCNPRIIVAGLLTVGMWMTAASLPHAQMMEAIVNGSPPMAPAAYVGPLDVSGAGSALGAYCMRKCTTSYSGHIVNIRRASDSTTTDCDGLADGSFDDSCFSTFCASTTCFVTVWYDQSGTGSGSDQVQGTAGTQPQMILSRTTHGKPALLCNRPGSTGILGNRTGTVVPSSTYSIAAYWKTTSNTAQYGAAATYTNGVTTGGVYHNGSTTNTAYFNASPQASDTSAHGYVGIQNGTAVDLYVDGTDNAASGADTLAGTSNFVVGTDQLGNTCTADISEVIFWLSALSGSAAAGVSSNAAAYY